jgi:uncharacterized protein
MSLFLIIFLSVYGSLQFYSLARLSKAFRFSSATAGLFTLLILLMTAVPILIRMLEHRGYERLPMYLAWPGFIWMGAVFLFVSALTVVDVFRLLLCLVYRIKHGSSGLSINPVITCELALILATSAVIYSFFEARNIRTEYLSIKSKKIPAQLGRVRIVQISDVHLGLLAGQDRLHGILKKVEAAGPDILVSTGDLVDGRLTRQESAGWKNLATVLAAVHAPKGKFAVLGNHEVYSGVGQAEVFTRSAGFTVLRGESAVAAGVSISGMDDPALIKAGQEVRSDTEQKMLQAAGQERFKVLLKHRPLVEPASERLFDLQLSGHTHQGQIFPFGFLVRLKFPVIGGTTKTAAGSLLHVSRGSGTWGPPLRLLAPPEVTIIDLLPEK